MNRHFYIGLLLILFGGISLFSFGQNFQKVYRFDDTTCLLSAVHVNTADSAIYVFGDLGRGTQRSRFLTAKIDTLGNYTHSLIGSSSYFHNYGFSHGKITEKGNGKFLSHYRSYPLNGGKSVPTLLEIDLDGNVLFENYGLPFWPNFTSYSDRSVSTLFNKRLYTSSYFYYDGDSDTTSNAPNRRGITYMCFDSMNNFIWRKEINPQPFREHVTAEILPFKDSILFVIYNDYYNNPNLVGSNSKVHFTDIDINGNILRDRIFQPFPYTIASSNVQLVNNDRYFLMTFSESQQTYYAGQNTVIVRPLISLIDTSLNIIWSKPLARNYRSHTTGIEFAGYSPKYYILDELDSSFVYAHTCIDSNDIPISGLVIEKANVFNGQEIWRRKYSYYPNELNCCYTELYASSIVPWDSGYVFVGTSYNYDSLGAGVPGQLGYVLKTNCLGHLGNPIAGASFTYNDSLGVHFESTSIQDGSVSWYFGDGSIENRGEYQDSVFHQYDSSGSQEVMLVAHGCLGVKDTLRFTLEIPEYIEPTDSTEGPEPPTVVYTKTLAIAPNPTIEGEPLSVYLGDLPDGGATLVFMDQNGKQIQKFYFPSGQSMYMLPLSLAAGVYELVLMANGDVLDKERLVVR